MKRALAIILWLALLPSAWAQGVFTPTVGLQASSIATFTQGPGDINSYNAYYGIRAYSVATLGNKLVNACNSTGGSDVLCMDLSSSPTTGDIVPASISGIICPGNANCTIKTAYDLTGNGNDVTQATPSLRPTFTTIGSNSRNCMAFNGSQLLRAVATPTMTIPTTFSFVAERTGPTTSVQVAFVLTNNTTGRPSMGFNNASGAIFLFSGSTAVVTGNTEGAPHSVQGTIATIVNNSIIMTDGTPHTGLNTGNTAAIASGTPMIGAATTSANFLTGVVCEVGYINADASANNATINTNQHNWYGF